MKTVFSESKFEFPYVDLSFPGQDKEERILFVTRESETMLYLRLMGLFVVVGLLFLGSWLVPWGFKYLGITGWNELALVPLAAALVFLFVGGWWLYSLWRKSVFILTTRRLTKFIYSTPFNRYNLSLSLDNIVDTGAYARGYWQALFGMGTFSARSSAGNRQEKYFFIENVHRAEDLAN